MPPLTRETDGYQACNILIVPRECPVDQRPVGRVDRRVGTRLTCGLLSSALRLYAVPAAPSRVDFNLGCGSAVASGGRVGCRSGAQSAASYAGPDGAADRDRPTDRERREGAASAGSETRERSATGLVKTSTGQPSGDGDPAQLLVGVDRMRVADHLEHVHVGDRVAVGVAAVQVVAALARPARGSRGPSPRRTRSSRSRRCTCRRRSPAWWRPPGRRRASRRSGPTTSEPDADTMTTSRPASWCSSIRQTASSYTSGSTMLCRVSATISRTVATSQPATQLRHELPHLLHLVVVGAADEEDELGVRRAQHRAARDQPAGLEGLAERQRARLGDDRLVEVEEGRGRARAPRPSS